jgi:hypothetical protein
MMSRRARLAADGYAARPARRSCSILHRRRGGYEPNVAKLGARGNGELPMNDAQRYRLNAAECLSAAERCELPYRGLTLAVAEAWLSLARQQEAMDELLAIWSEASADTLAESRPQSFILSTFTIPHSPLPQLVHA